MFCLLQEVFKKFFLYVYRTCLEVASVIYISRINIFVLLSCRIFLHHLSQVSFFEIRVSNGASLLENSYVSVGKFVCVFRIRLLPASSGCNWSEKKLWVGLTMKRQIPADNTWRPGILESSGPSLSYSFLLRAWGCILYDEIPSSGNIRCRFDFPFSVAGLL